MQKTRLPQIITRRLTAPDFTERLAMLTTGYTPHPEQELREPSYYDYPVLKQPSWGWEIILYFFCGGLAAGCYVIASIAALFGSPEDRVVARTGYYLSLLALIPCPILLIKDLGRPERFLNMLRMFKVKSPMSMGVWGLLSFSFFSGIAVAIQAARDGLLGRWWGAQGAGCSATTSPRATRNSVRYLSWRLHRRSAGGHQRAALVTQQIAWSGIYFVRVLHQFRPHLAGIAPCQSSCTFVT